MSQHILVGEHGTRIRCAIVIALIDSMYNGV